MIKIFKVLLLALFILVFIIDDLVEASSNPFSQTKFNPNISVTSDFSYFSRNIKDEDYRNLYIPGFTKPLLDDNILPENGFNLNYVEVDIRSTVDPYFDFVSVFHIDKESIEIEEAYFQTRSLPYNLKLKGGKFLSSFGRLNSQHQHFWSFSDAPLIYKSILGEEGINETGLQLTYLAPLPFFLQLGTELFQGDNEFNFNRFGFTLNTKQDLTGDDIVIKDTKKPNLFTSFIKASWDIGNTSILTGLSHATGDTRINTINDFNEALAGKTNLYNFELTIKHIIDSYRYLQFQGEYITRKFSGNRFYYNNNDLVISNYKKNQAGFYLQTIYKFNQRYRAGFRYDLITKNDIFENSIKQDIPNSLYRYSFMIDFLPSEFSYIRLQYNIDRSLFKELNSGIQREKVNEFMIQFNFSIGAHGTHAF